jgi:hypothetical protein
MQNVNRVSGRIIDIRRYVAPLSLYGQQQRRECWELWIATPSGAEEQLIVESRAMPARRGHRAVLAIESGAPVGIVNLTTRVRTNFARSDPLAADATERADVASLNGDRSVKTL